MSRTPTNFGPYEHEYKARVPRRRRLIKLALQLAVVAVAVTLAGLFLFPMTKPQGVGVEREPTAPGTSAETPAVVRTPPQP